MVVAFQPSSNLIVCYLIVWNTPFHISNCDLATFLVSKATIIMKKKDRFEMKVTHKWPFYNHFLTIFCHMYVHLSQNWGSGCHFEMINGSKSWFFSWVMTQNANISISAFLQFCRQNSYVFFNAFCDITFVQIKI